MGVPGLWDVLRPAGQQRSLTHLAVVDGFERNPGGRRGLRVGIDASIWFYHATYGREGENPELRTLFFRCARLMSKPFLPLFVFDGPKRPKVKRKKKISGKDHWMISGMQEIIEAFGFEWRMAPGEAEAELAYLNRTGVIDAIITDDVDTFLFGATTLIRNPGKMLSGNTSHPMKNASGIEDGEHAYVYNSKDISSHEEVELTTGGLILIGLLRGGDYDPEGLPGCGVNVAHALARCGFGDSLLEAARTLPREQLPSFLTSWRHEVRQELKTNAHGYMSSKRNKLATSLPESFPDIEILLLYANPLTSAQTSRGSTTYLWDREPDLGKLAALCERKFEWGVKPIIIKRFRTVIWAPAVLRILRRAVLDEDERKKKADGFVNSLPSTPRKAHKQGLPKSPGTPSMMITKHFSSLRIDEDDEDEDGRLIVKIHSKREHASTDGIPEYRLEIAPAQLVRLTESGVQGFRKLPGGTVDEDDDEYDFDDDDDDEDGGGKKKKRSGPKKPPPEPHSNLRVWMPASMVRIVEPELVDDFEGAEERKRKKKADAAERKALKAQGLAVPKKTKSSGSASSKVGSRKGPVTKSKAAPEEEEEESEEDFSDVFGLKNPRNGTKTTRKAASKPIKRLPVFEEEEEEEEEELPPTPIFTSVGNGSGKLASRKENEPPRRSTNEKKDKETKVDHSSKLSKRPTLLELLDQVPPPPPPHPSSPRSTLSERTKAPCPNISSSGPSGSKELSTTRKNTKGKELKAKSTARASSSLTSDSDSPSLLSSPKKSRRKSKEHTSPVSRASGRTSVNRSSSNADVRKMKPLLVAQARKASNGNKPQLKAPVRHEDEEVEESAEEEEEYTRPGSPSPIRPNKTIPRSKPGRLGTVAMRSVNNSNAMPSAMQPVRTITCLDVIELSSDSESDAPQATSALAEMRRVNPRTPTIEVEIIDLT